jgi:hypothetical protein
VEHQGDSINHSKGKSWPGARPGQDLPKVKTALIQGRHRSRTEICHRLMNIKPVTTFQHNSGNWRADETAEKLLTMLLIEIPAQARIQSFQ